MNAPGRNITLQSLRRKIRRQRCLSVSKHSRIEVSSGSLMRRCGCSQDPKIYGFLDEHGPGRDITQRSRLIFGQRKTPLPSGRNVVVGRGLLSPNAVTAIYPRHVVNIVIGVPHANHPRYRAVQQSTLLSSNLTTLPPTSHKKH